MLITWVNCHFEEGDDGKEVTVRYPGGVVVPDCCGDVQRCMTVRLGRNLQGDFESPMGEDNPPIWISGGYPREALQDRYFMKWTDHYPPPPKFCPHCGERLPAIELRPEEGLPGPVNPDEDDYCGSCEQRHRNCRCYPVTVRWQTVKE
jgi:hypothetical protein